MYKTLVGRKNIFSADGFNTLFKDFTINLRALHWMSFFMSM